MRVHALLTLALSASTMGCFASDSRHQAVDAGADVEDASVDAVQEVGDADAEWDAGGNVDDASANDATEDSAVCVCEPAGPCVVAACSLAGVCTQSARADGSACGESDDMVCVGGACVVRGCGDGYRETGPAPARESCDDGNLEDGDGCDSLCRPTVQSLDADPAGEFEVSAHPDSYAMAADGAGTLLVAYAYESFSHSQLRCVRVSKDGKILGAPIELQAAVPSPGQLTPVVAGLAGGGWVVAWSAVRQGSFDILLRIVSPEGVVSPERVANAERTASQWAPSVASLGSGFVLAWSSSRATTTDPDGGVYARTFAANGVPTSGEVRVAADASGAEQDVEVATADSSWIAAFTSTGAAQGHLPTLRARRFSGVRPIDVADVEIAISPSSSPTLALAGTNWIVAFESAADDRLGDVLVRSIPVEGTPSVANLFSVDESATADGDPEIVGLFDSFWLAHRHSGLPRVLALAEGPWTNDFAALRATIETRGVDRPVFASSPFGVWAMWRAFDENSPTYLLELTLVRVP